MLPSSPSGALRLLRSQRDGYSKSSHSNKACLNVRLREFGKLEGIPYSENFANVTSECRVTPAEQWRVACSISLSGSNLISQLSRLPIKERIRGGAAEAARGGVVKHLEAGHALCATL